MALNQKKRGEIRQFTVESFIDMTTAEPAAPVKGQSWINTVGGTSSITGQPVSADTMYTWAGSSFIETPLSLFDEINDVTAGKEYVYSAAATYDETSSTVNDAATTTVTATPTNYTAATADVEAHLAGIDTALGQVADEVIIQSGAFSGSVPAGAQVGIDDTTGQFYFPQSGQWVGSPINVLTLPDWTASTVYTAGKMVTAVSPTTAVQTIYRRLATGTSGTTFDAAEETLWLSVASMGGGGGGGAVASVFGRTGAVVAAASDYDANQIDVTATPSNYTAGSADVEAHLAGIDAQFALIPDEVVENAGALSGAAPTGAQMGVDTSTGSLYYVSGGTWTAVPTATVDLNTTVSLETGANGTGLTVPTTAPGGTPDIGDLHIEIYDDVTLYFTAVAANWTAPAVVEVARDILDASGFSGNLTTSDTTLQAVADKFDAYAGNDRIFADDTTVAPATAGEPTESEIATFAGTNRDAVIYYTGTDTSTDAPTYIFHIDKSGNVTTLEKPQPVTIGTTNSDSGLNLVTNNGGVLADVDQNAIKTIVLGAAPVDGTTVAYFAGQLFWDNVNKKLYEATAKSTDPDTAGTGSTFAEINLSETVQTLTDAATVAWDVSLGKTAILSGASLASNVSITNATPGDRLTLIASASGADRSLGLPAGTRSQNGVSYSAVRLQNNVDQAFTLVVRPDGNFLIENIWNDSGAAGQAFSANDTVVVDWSQSSFVSFKITADGVTATVPFDFAEFIRHPNGSGRLITVLVEVATGGLSTESGFVAFNAAFKNADNTATLGTVEVPEGTTKVWTFAVDANGTELVLVNPETTGGAVVQTLTDGASITWDATNGEYAVLNLNTVGATLQPIANPEDGKLYILNVRAGAPRRLDFDTKYKYSTGTPLSGGIYCENTVSLAFAYNAADDEFTLVNADNSVNMVGFGVSDGATLTITAPYATTVVHAITTPVSGTANITIGQPADNFFAGLAGQSKIVHFVLAGSDVPTTYTFSSYWKNSITNATQAPITVAAGSRKEIQFVTNSSEAFSVGSTKDQNLFSANGLFAAIWTQLTPAGETALDYVKNTDGFLITKIYDDFTVADVYGTFAGATGFTVFENDGSPVSYATPADDAVIIPAGFYQWAYVGTTVQLLKMLSASSVQATLVNSVSGAVALTLPAATGSGDVYFYANEDVQSNIATLQPATGEILNNAINGLFYFSNYADGTQFVVTDIAVGKWVVAVEGASTTVASKFYHWEGAFDNLDPTNADNDFEAFDLTTAIASVGAGSYHLDPANEIDPGGYRSGNNITIPAGHYRIQYTVMHPNFSVLGGTASVQEDQGVFHALLSDGTNTWYGNDANQAGDAYGGISMINQVMTLTVPTTFSLGYTADIDAGASNFEDFGASFTVTEVKQPSEVYLAGMVTPEPLVSGRTNLATTYSGPWTPGVWTDLPGVTVTLPKAGTYRLFGAFNARLDVSAANGGVFWRAFDVTNNAAIDDTYGVQWAGSGASSNDAASNYIEAEVTVTGATEIKLQANYNTSLNTLTIYGKDFGTAPVNTFLAYQQLPSSQVVNPGSVPVEDLHSAKIYATANQNVDFTAADYPATGVFTSSTNPVEVVFDTAEYDANGLADLVNNKFVILQDGVYDISSLVTYADGANISQFGSQIIKNGTTVLGTDNQYANGNSGAIVKVNANAIGVPLLAGDEITLLTKRFRENNVIDTEAGISNVYLEIAQRSSKTITYLDPEFTEAKNLDYYQAKVISTFTTGTNELKTNIANPTNWGIVEDKFSTVTTNDSDEIYLPVGEWELRFYPAVNAGDRWSPKWAVDGVEAGVAGTSSNDLSPAYYSPHPAVARVSVTSGTKTITLISRDAGTNVKPENTNDSGCWYEIIQLPSVEYVTPGDVPVENLSIGKVDLPTQSITNQASYVDVTAGDFVLSNAGTYLLTYCGHINGGTNGAGAALRIVDSGGTEVPGSECFAIENTTQEGEYPSAQVQVTIVAPETYKLQWKTTSSNIAQITAGEVTITWQQLPTKTVINTQELEVTNKNTLEVGLPLLSNGDGTATFADNGIHNIQTFTSSGTYTPTSGTRKAIVYVTGGGGGGGNTPSGINAAYGDGGSAGGTQVAFLTIDDSITGTATVGAGGAASTNGNASSLVYNGVTVTGARGIQGADGVNDGGDRLGTQATGGGGSSTAPGYTITGGHGGSALYFSTSDTGRSGAGGSSYWGPGGKEQRANGTASGLSGNDGVAPGSGGGGALQTNNSTQSGGVGADGIIVIYEYK